jgi:HK97 family phage prohead protease
MRIYRTFEIGPAIETRRDGEPAKTYSAVLTTGTPVKRRSFWGEAFTETLSMAPGSIDLSRAPIPFLTSHDTQSLPIGLVDNIRIDGNDLRGEITFGRSERARAVQADVDDGVIRSISVGYSRDEVKETRDRDGRLTAIIATRWTLFEVSAVSLPADPSAGFNRTIGEDMDPEVLAALGLPPDTTREQYLAAIRALNQRATAADTDRRAELRQSALERGLFTLGSDRERLFNAAAERDVGEARALAETWASSPAVPVGGPTGSFMQSRSYPDPDQPSRSRSSYRAGGRGDDFREAAVDALLLRAGIPIKDPHPAAGDIDASVRGLASICLSRAGRTVDQGDSLEGMVRRSFEGVRGGGIGAQSSDDFVGILVDALHVAARTGYEQEPASHRMWLRPVPVTDFREQHRPILGSAPALREVLEGGEYETGALTDDAAVPYKVKKWGRIVSLTFEAIVNDSLGSFIRILPGLGQAARRTEADLVYNHLTENSGDGPQMQDENNLFDDTNHGNVVDAGTFDAAQLGLGRLRLRKQTAVGGGILSLVPRYLIAPAERETEAEILLAQATKHIDVAGASEAETPRWLANLVLVIEPRLADGAVYLAADSAQIDTIEMGLLGENMAGPRFFEEQGFRIDSQSWKARHVIGVRALDWRGLVKINLT